MPQLPKTKAKEVGNAESTAFEALPAGPYVAALKDCKVAPKEGPSGPYWIWEFEVGQPEEYAKRRLWVNTSLSEAADWKLKEVFDAFGADYDTDTDELINQVVLLQVSQRIIEQGSRKGDLGNNVDRVLPYDISADLEGQEELI